MCSKNRLEFKKNEIRFDIEFIIRDYIDVNREIVIFLDQKNEIRKKRFDKKNEIRKRRVARETNLCRLLRKQNRLFKCYHALNKRENHFVIQKQRVFVAFNEFESFEIFYEFNNSNLKSLCFVVEMFDEIISSLSSKKID